MGKVPFFSVVVPTFNRLWQVSNICLKGLSRLDYPRDRFEVIVVDDGGDVPLDEVVGAYTDCLPVKLVRQKHAGVAAARNTGAARANGRILAFTDDDCMPAKDWLKKLAGRFASNPQCAITGKIVDILEKNSCAAASQLLVSYLYGYYNTEEDGAVFATGNNLAMPAKLFREIGGFDESFSLVNGGEDREFVDRWRFNGYRLIFAPEVIVYHAHNLKFATFLKQHFRYGRGAFHFHRKRLWRGQGSLRIEPWSFYKGLFECPFVEFNGPRALTIFALLMVSQAANAAGYFWERAGRFKKYRLYG